MKIAVLLKQVPDSTAKITIQNGEIDDTNLKWSMSPYDEYALEAALIHAEHSGGEVVAITYGPERTEKMLKDAAAVGVKRLIRIWCSSSDSEDVLSVSNFLTDIIKKEKFDFVYAGKASSDLNMATTGPAVAELLGWPCISYVSQINHESPSMARLGMTGLELVEFPSNGVITCDKGLTDLRRANVKGIMAAKKASIEFISVESVGSLTSSEGLFEPPEKSPGRMFEGASSVSEVVDLLRSEAKVI